MSDLPTRVAGLEQIAKDTAATLREIKDDLRSLRADNVGFRAEMAALRADVSELKGRMANLATVADVSELKGKVSNLPTTWAMLTTFVGAMVGVGGLALALARFLPRL